MKSKPYFLYRHYDEEGLLLYVGISLSAVQRLCQHKHLSPWFSCIRRIEMEPFANKSAAEAAEKEAIALESPVWNIKTNYGDSIAGLTQVAFSAERIADSSSYPYSQEEIYDLGDYAALSVIKGAVGNTPFNTNDLLQTFDITESLAKRLGRAPNPRYLGHLLKRLEGKATPSGIIKRVGKRGDKGIVWAITSRNDGKERAAA